MADDLDQMTTRIGVELMAGGRSDLSTQVQSAIRTAVRHYRATGFWFNRGVVEGATVEGQAAYDAPETVLTVEEIRIDWGSGFFPLGVKTWRQLQDFRTGSQTNGKPVRYAEYGGQWWLHQTPDDVYDLEWSGIIDLGALDTGTDTNAWMVEGEELIRQRARAIVQIDVLKDAEAKAEALQIAAMGGPGKHCLSLLERAALRALRGETNKRQSTGRIAPG